MSQDWWHYKVGHVVNYVIQNFRQSVWSLEFNSLVVVKAELVLPLILLNSDVVPECFCELFGCQSHKFLTLHHFFVASVLFH